MCVCVCVCDGRVRDRVGLRVIGGVGWGGRWRIGLPGKSFFLMERFFVPYCSAVLVRH